MAPVEGPARAGDVVLACRGDLRAAGDGVVLQRAGRWPAGERVFVFCGGRRGGGPAAAPEAAPAPEGGFLFLRRVPHAVGLASAIQGGEKLAKCRLTREIS